MLSVRGLLSVSGTAAVALFLLGCDSKSTGSAPHSFVDSGPHDLALAPDRAIDTPTDAASIDAPPTDGGALDGADAPADTNAGDVPADVPAGDTPAGDTAPTDTAPADTAPSDAPTDLPATLDVRDALPADSTVPDVRDALPTDGAAADVRDGNAG